MSCTSPVAAVLTATTVAGVDYLLAPATVMLKVGDGSARLLDLDGECFGLPADSATSLEVALRSGVREAAEQVARRYAIPVERAQADLETFLDALKRRGLLVRRGAYRGWHRWRSGTIARLLSRGIRFGLRGPRSEYCRIHVLLVMASLCLRLLGWARTVELWMAATVTGPLAPPIEGASCQIDRTVRTVTAYHPFPVDCKARALCCWALARDLGLSARLVVGIDLFPFLGHCWCEIGAYTLADTAERCARFTPVLQYP